MQIKTETIVGFFIVSALGVFVYAAFFLGGIHSGHSSYHQYSIYFNDVSGLEKKAEVKIAGVKVGWVENVSLSYQAHCKACVVVMLHHKYPLYEDASGIIRQESMLGAKYLEICPGSIHLAQLSQGAILETIGTAYSSADEMLYKMEQIMKNVSDIALEIRACMYDQQAQEKFHKALEYATTAAVRCASLCTVLDRIISNNEGSLDTMIVDCKEVTSHMKEILPSAKECLEELKAIMYQAQGDLMVFKSVANKLDQGKGILGKLFKYW